MLRFDDISVYNVDLDVISMISKGKGDKTAGKMGHKEKESKGGKKKKKLRVDIISSENKR
jgi:hypothetical protein